MYSVADLKELIEYHLVTSAPNDDMADNNLAQLVTEISGLRVRSLWREATSVFCDRCGCSVDTELIRPEGHHHANDGDFYCEDCWEGLA